MSDWKTVRLGDICAYENSRISIAMLNDENYISTENMLPNKGDICRASSLPTVSATTNFVKGQTLISNIRPYFKKIWFADKDGGCSNDVLCFRLNEDIDNRYFYYLLSQDSFFDYVMSGSKGTKMPRGDRGQIMQFKFLLPPIEEQGRIAGILGALDDKIECNNRINRNLEEQASVLFRRWFVDFEFPDSDPTSPTYGKPYRSAGGTTQDSPLGSIPHGWQVGITSDYFNISIGKTPPRAESHWFSRDKKDVIWVSISNMGNSGVYINDSSEYLTAESIKKFNVVLVPSNTVILSFKLTVGRVAITNGVTTTNEAIAHFKTDNTEITEYLYLLLKTYDYQSMGSTSSIATAVNSKMVKAMTIMIPNKEVLSMFHKNIYPIFERIKTNQTENQTLATLRDTLLPKLMNNEINI